MTADRVLVIMDTRVHPDRISTRFAYVAVSRASQDAQIYTNDAAALDQRLSHDGSKSSAVDFRQQAQTVEPKGKHIDNDAQHGFRQQNGSREATKERIYTPDITLQSTENSVPMLLGSSPGFRRTERCRAISTPALTATSTSTVLAASFMTSRKTPSYSTPCSTARWEQ